MQQIITVFYFVQRPFLLRDDITKPLVDLVKRLGELGRKSFCSALYVAALETSTSLKHKEVFNNKFVVDGGSGSSQTL